MMTVDIGIDQQQETKCFFMRYNMKLTSLVVAIATFAASSASGELLSGFYDPTVENAWTFVVTGNVNGGEPVADEQAVTNKAYGLISDEHGWVCKVRIVDAAQRTLKLGVAARDIYKAYPTDSAARQLDLSGPVKRGDEAWTLTHVSNAGEDFMQNDSSGKLIRLKLFRAPKTLILGFYKPFKGTQDTGYQNLMETLILDCPLVSSIGIGSEQFGTSMSNLTRVYLNLPEVTETFNLNLGAAIGKLGETDVSDWRLDKVPSLTRTSVFKTFSGAGVLRLPSVTELSASALKGSALTGLEIGTAKTEADITIGASAAAGAALTNIVLGGSGCSFHIDTNAFTCANLTHITLNGGVPTWTNEGVVFGTEAAQARTMVFAPELCDEWTTVMRSDAVTPLSTSRRAVYAAEHPGEPVPCGVAAASVFRTFAEQYVVYALDIKPKGLIIIFR